jgi:hypothetical protein
MGLAKIDTFKILFVMESGNGDTAANVPIMPFILF